MFDIDATILGPLMAVFGENTQPVFSPATGAASFAIDGVFDDGFSTTDILDDGAPGFSTSNPVLGVRLAQFPAGSPPVAGDGVVIVVGGSPTAYLVNQVRPDGHGWAKLELTLQAVA